MPECSLAGKEEELEADRVVDLGAAKAEDHQGASALDSRPSILDDEAQTALARIVGLDLLHDCEILPAVVTPPVATRKRKRSIVGEEEDGSNLSTHTSAGSASATSVDGTGTWRHTFKRWMGLGSKAV